MESLSNSLARGIGEHGSYCALGSWIAWPASLTLVLLLQTVSEETCASLWCQWNLYPCFCDWVFKSLLCSECFFLNGKLPITQPSTLHLRQKVNLTIHIQWRVPSSVTVFIAPRSDFAVPSEALDMDGMVRQLEIFLIPWKKGTGALSLRVTYLVICDDVLKNSYSLFLKARISAAQTLLLVLNWVKCVLICSIKCSSLSTSPRCLFSG